MTRTREADPPIPTTTAVLTRPGLDELVAALVSEGYRVVAPTVRDGAIVLAEITSGLELPSGWGVETGPGHYRLRPRADAAVFGHSAGTQSWKEFLHPSRQPLFTSSGGDFVATDEPPARLAFLGVRACDLAALAILNRVLGAGEHLAGTFAQRRHGLLVIAAGCTEPGDVCFCASMGTGPAPGPGYDIALTERIDRDGHRFLVDVGTQEGARVLGLLSHRPATGPEIEDAHAGLAAAVTRMGRAMPAGDIRALLGQGTDSPVWTEVAERCLTCGNCTAVCPTCFCTTTTDTTVLGGESAERSQRWASCFELDFSYLHGGSVRVSGASRYRQWITHKLSTWYDQFGSSGCVGCGRCIAWCPTGIDITQEVARLDSLRPARPGAQAEDGEAGDHPAAR
jgi:ferredoxin